MTDIQQKGGIFIGKSHAQGGIDVVVPETGQRLEVEGKEPLIPKEALSDNKVYTYTGTNFDILNKINTSIGAKSITQKATTVHAGDVIICKKTLYDNTTKTLHGTHKQIVSAINENAGCSTIEPGAVMHKENGEVLQFEDGGNIPEKLRNFTQQLETNNSNYDISGVSNKTTQSLIESARIYLRRNAENTKKGKTTIKIKKQEEECLKKFAEDNGIFFNICEFDKYISEGAEQQTYFHTRKSIIKLNTSIFYEKWDDYLLSLEIHNILFPKTNYQLIGFTIDDNGVFKSVVKQSYIESNEPTNLEDVKKLMAQNGFENTKNNDYYNPELGIILEDLHDENVLTKDGVLYFIDTVFYVRPSEFKNGGSIPEKQDIALKDLESRLTIAKKMAAKNPEFKGRIKIIEKMMANKKNSILLAPNGKPSNLTPEQYRLVRTPKFKAWFGDWEKDPENASKVVDENGEPLVVYHGTKDEFTVFDKEKTTVYGLYGQNFYFTNKLKISKDYLGGILQKKTNKSHIKSVFLNVRKPYIFDVQIPDEEIEEFQKIVLKNKDEFWLKRIYEDNELPKKWEEDWLINPKYVNEKDLRVLKNSLKSQKNDIYSSKNKELHRIDVYAILTDNLHRIHSKKILNEFLSKKFDGFFIKHEGSGLRIHDTMFEEHNVYVAFNSNQIKLADGTNTTFDANNPDIRFEGGGIIPPSDVNELLTDLYKDHHEAWAYMDAISKEVNQENCTACAKKIITKFNDELKHHFDEEEQDFFPYVKKKQNKLNSLIIDELIIQHKWFLAKINEMEQHPTPAAIKEFCNQLIEHIKLEEYLMNKYLKDPFKNNDMEKTMTLKQITEILDKSQIPYNRKLSHIYGSEYWDIRGVGYRLSDHPKSKWRQSERIEISLYGNNYQPLYEELLQRKDIDLTDKTNWEKEYIEFAKKTIIPREKDGLLVTPDGSLYNNDEQGLINATKGMWNRKVYFPIKNKGLNDFVKKEALKKELNNLYDYGTEEEIEKIKKQLSEVEILQNGGQADFISSAETQRRRVENMNEPQRAEELSKEVMKIYRNKTNKLFRPEDGIVKVYANIYKINPEHTAEIFNTNASKIVDQLFEQGGQAPLKPLPNTTIQMKEQSQNKTGYEKFKVIHTNNNKPEIEEFDYYSDALESFEKHKKQGHIPRLEGWHNATDFNVIMRTPKYQKGDKVTMFDDEPALTIEKVNEWSDKLATYDLSSANGVIDRRNISETKLSLYNEEVKMADGGEIPSKELIIKHLNTLPHEKFADDAAYILSADLDKILWRSEEEEGRKVISEQVADKIISSENANTYLKEISYFKNGGVVAASTKINFEPTTEAQLRISLLAIKEQYPDNKREASSGYYMVQNNFFNEVVSYNPTMLVALLKVGKEILNKGDRFVVGNILLPDFKDANTERFFSNLSVPLWTLIPNELRNVQPIKQLPFSPSPKNNNLAKITDLFVGTDDLRPNMMGAYFDVTNNAIVATNANIMLHIDEKPTIKEDEICILGKNTKKFSELDENNSKNLQAIKDGCLKVDANYPAWTRVIPRDFDNIVTVKTEEVYKFCKILVENKLTPPITNHILLLNEKLKLGITAVYLGDSLKAMLLLGYKEVDFCFQEIPNRPIMIIPKGNARKISASSDNIETDFVLIMPFDSDRFSVNYNWTYDLDKKCIENEGLEKLGCVDLDTTEEAKVEASLIKPGDFVQKKHTHNKHYFVESVNNDKLTLINTVTLKKVTDANAVDYTPIKATEKEGVEYAYNFNKRKAATEKLRKQHPIVLESTEASDVANKTYNNLEELEADLKSFGFTETPTKTYIKNKVWIKGYPHHIQIDLSKMDHDFNPEEEKLLTWLKNYDNKFDFEQFSEAIKKQQKQAKKQKVAEIMEAIETLEALLPIMDNAADKKAIRKQIEELDKQLGEGGGEKNESLQKFVEDLYVNEYNLPKPKITKVEDGFYIHTNQSSEGRKSKNKIFIDNESAQNLEFVKKYIENTDDEVIKATEKKEKKTNENKNESLQKFVDEITFKELYDGADIPQPFYDAYKSFIETGEYPYNKDVAEYFSTKFNLPEQKDKLETIVYWVSQNISKQDKKEYIQNMLRDGWKILNAESLHELYQLKQPIIINPDIKGIKEFNVVLGSEGEQDYYLQHSRQKKSAYRPYGSNPEQIRFYKLKSEYNNTETDKATEKMAKGGVITEYPTKYIIDNNIVLRVKVITEYEEDGKQLAFVSGPFSKESRKLVNKSDLFDTREEAENFLGDWQSIGYFKNGGEINEKNFKATLTFPNKELAQEFATKWGRYSKRGHVVGAGEENVPVTIWDLTEKDKEWVDNYINQINNSNQ